MLVALVVGLVVILVVAVNDGLEVHVEVDEDVWVVCGVKVGEVLRDKVTVEVAVDEVVEVKLVDPVVDGDVVTVLVRELVMLVVKEVVNVEVIEVLCDVVGVVIWQVAKVPSRKEFTASLSIDT